MSSSRPSIQLTLYAGAATLQSVPAFIAEALQSVEITYGDSAPSACQMTFHADRNLAPQADYALLSSPLLQPGGRIGVAVSLNGLTQPLADGFITSQELAHTTPFGASTISIIAQDVSVLMDVHELSRDYPGLSDELIAGAVLAPYAVFGIVPLIVPTPTSPVSDPLVQVPQQNATDRAYLQQLASPYAYVFFVRPAATIGLNTAYWGPPPRYTAPQKALTVNVGPASNVESISFTHNALAATFVHGFVQDADIDDVVPVVTVSGSRMPPLAARPALTADLPLTRTTQFTDSRTTAVRAFVEAQATTDVSTDDVVIGQGQLDVLRYGAILQAPGIVGVRGVGNSYDGNYYVKSVTHKISRASYKQQFTLSREGQGTTVTRVAV